MSLPMQIGALAAAAGCPVETVRYYERARLLPLPTRQSNNYRTYGPTHLERLRFIRNCREHDMSLRGIRELLRVADAPGGDCGDADATLDAHLGHVRARIAQLSALEKELSALRKRCSRRGAARECGVLNDLRQAAR